MEAPGRVLYSDDFTSKTGAPGEIFMQWKGSNICADFRCECGSGEHLCDATFVYRIRCGDCGAIYEMPHTLPLRKVEDDEGKPTYDTDPTPAEAAPPNDHSLRIVTIKGTVGA